ncbi:hypothetical protein V7139_20850 [Neobacillus drentensis]|uniref:hypothetical protein n=1 Tax=Neobacillus drentensis TaxID=220684 RepID=UPI0030038B00
MCVPIVALIALFFTFFGGNSIIALLIMAYSFVLQLFPPLFLSLWKKNPVTKTGAAAGIIAGVIMVAYVTLTSSTMATFFPKAPSFIKDLDVGIAALVINIVFMFVVSAFTKTSVKIKTEMKTKAV